MMQVQPIECIVSAGELIFVPRGWWHMAINLEPGVAVTQNYVSRSNLPHVLQVWGLLCLECLGVACESCKCLASGLQCLLASVPVGFSVCEASVPVGFGACWLRCL